MRIEVTATDISITETDKLVSGSKLVYTATFVFTGWDGLTKTAVFKPGRANKVEGIPTIECAITGESVTVPWEVLQNYGGRLWVGVYGSDSTGIVKPTTWVDAGPIQQGVDQEAENGTAPTPSKYQQLVDSVAANATKATAAAASAEEAKQSTASKADDKVVFTAAATNTDLASGDTNETLWGKAAKWFTSLNSHLADKVVHITGDERTAWNANTTSIASVLADLAPTEASTTASAAHAIDAFFTLNNKFYQCTTKAIAAGDTIAEGTNCTKTDAGKVLSSLKSAYANLSGTSAGLHNSVYRGKDITADLDTILAQVALGDFSNVYVGDYFTKTINGTSYTLRVAGCDVYLNRGDTTLTNHHLVIIPDASFGAYVMNATNITDGGYVGSVMYTDTLVKWAGYLDTAFGTHLIVNKETLSDAVSGGIPSNRSWYSSKVNLMTSEEVVGHAGYGVSGSNYANNIGIAYGQLPLFRLAPDKICTQYAYWLRNITGSTYFASVASNGILNYYSASSVLALRPRFLLG